MFPAARRYSSIVFAFCWAATSLLAFLRPSTLKAQAAPPSQPGLLAFLAEVATKYPAAAAMSSVTLEASANWTVGAQKETGTAELKASADGSSSIQLNLDKATRTETRTTFTDSRACQWIDSQGTHALNYVDCNMPIAWFSPLFALQPIALGGQLSSVVDDGQVTRASGTYRSMSFTTNLYAHKPTDQQFFTSGTKASILFDPQTLLPYSVEYLQHADSDLNMTFPVRIVYSNYQTVNGVPTPYQIDRYVNNVLQLSLTITNASL